MRIEPASRSRDRAARLVALFAGWILAAGAAAAAVITGKDPETGLASWTWEHEGVSVQLVQLLPDQTRAFFLGRGFDADSADRVGRACVFQTIFRNDGKRPVEHDLRTWIVRHSGRSLPLRTRDDWEAEWRAQGVAEAPRIAFRWALLPTVQRFEPGDYNWGMTSYGLPPGERFDLSLSASIGGEPTAGEIPSVICAEDR